MHKCKSGIGKTFALSVALGSVLGLSTSATAGELIFQPLNPAFGGSPLLDDYLLGTAGLQNQFVNNGGGGGGGGAAAPPVINFPPITIDLGGVGAPAGGGGAPPPANAATGQSANSPAFVGQVNQ